jgi:hypothetical protein
LTFVGAAMASGSRRFELFDKKHGAQEWNDATGWQLKTGGAHEPTQDDIPF